MAGNELKNCQSKTDASVEKCQPEPVRCGCGGEAKVYIRDDLKFVVLCEECGIILNRLTEAEAITAWNKAMGAEKNSIVSVFSSEPIAKDINVPNKERKKGKWIVHDYALGRERYECSECKGRCDLEYNFCPHCGADMRGDHE